MITPIDILIVVIGMGVLISKRHITVYDEPEALTTLLINVHDEKEKEPSDPIEKKED